MVDERKVPEDWGSRKVEDISIMIASGTSKTKTNKNGDFPIYGSTGEIGRSIKYDYEGRKILVARVGANAGTLYTVDGKYLVSDNTLMIEIKKSVSFRYIYRVLKYLNLNKLVFGSGQPLITGTQLKEIVIDIPSLSEQKAIAEALSDTDNLIQSVEKLIDKKKKIKQGAMQQLLIGKKRLPGFSGEWEVKRLGEVADIRTGKRNNQDKVSDGLYPFFVRSQDVERINTYSYDGEAVLVPGEGGIGNIFHYINGKFEVHQRVYKISDFLNVSGKYVYYYMKQSFGAHAMKNTVKATVDSLRLPTFQEFELKIPNNLEEQKAIAQVLSDMDAEIEALEEKLEKYKTIKQGMMQELLTGRIRLI